MYTCCFTGNLGAPIEFAYSKNGDPYAKLDVAVYAGKDRDAHWVRVVLFGKPAEFLADQGGKKGDKVVVQCTEAPTIEMYEKKAGGMGISVNQKAVFVEVLPRAAAQGKTK